MCLSRWAKTKDNKRALLIVRHTIVNAVRKAYYRR